MEKRYCRTSKKNIIKAGTVIFAVLFAVLSVCSCSDRRADRGAASPEVQEIERLFESELAAVRDRSDAYAEVFAESGDRGTEYEHMPVGVDIDILYADENILSVSIATEAEDLSPYGRVKYYNIDRRDGRHLTLADVVGYDYRDVALRALLPRIETDADVYDGIDVAPMINEDRMFYLSDGGDCVVIVFDTGEIAPDSAGVKKYRVPLK